jgi:hypothetical protein
VTLIPAADVRGVDPDTGEPFYWRGWYDGARTSGEGGLNVTLRTSGTPYTFTGRIKAQVVGRQTPPFKAIPRYCDLYAFEAEGGDWVVQRRWISEAREEVPCHYAVERGDTLEDVVGKMLDFDPATLATNLLDEEQPGGKRRNDRLKAWLRSSYEARLRQLWQACL